MADGHSYSANAQQAASGTPACQSGGCEACQKIGLPLLLVRPGIADGNYTSGKQSLLRPLFNQELPLPSLPSSVSGYVARALRPGFVMVFYETPHTPELKENHGWQAFKVHAGGYLIPYYPVGMPSGQDGEGFSCQRTASYATAMLLVIPDAKRAGKVWVGYSDHFWSSKVREQYAADKQLRKQRMTRIDAKQAECRSSIELTADNVRNAIADYDPGRPANAFDGNPFAPILLAREPGVAGTRPERADDLAERAQQILGASNAATASRRDDYPLDAAKIICIADPIGATAEAAQRRVTLCSTSSDWVLSQAQGFRRFQSALMVEGLLKRAEDQGKARKAVNADPKYAGMNGREVSPTEFERLKQADKIPPDATLEPVYIYGWDGAEGDGRFRKPGVGQIRFVSNAEIDGDAKDFKEQVLDGLTEASKGTPAYRQFLDTHAQKARQDAQRLQKLEQDYGAWLNSEARKLVTAHDFDTESPADGIYYCDSVCKLTYAGPITDVGLEWYRDFLLKDPSDPEALLIRALLGNQKSAFEAFKPTKVLKEIKTFFKLIDEIEKAVTEGKAAGMPAGNRALLQAVPEVRLIARQLPVLRLLASSLGGVLMPVIGGTAMGLDKLQQLQPEFFAKLQIVVESGVDTLAGRMGVTIHKLQLPIDVAARYWRRQMGMTRELVKRTVTELESTRVKSLVLGGAMWFDLGGSPKLAEDLVDFYVAVRNGSQTSAPAVLGALEQTEAAGNKALAGMAGAVATGGDQVAQLARQLGKDTNTLLRDSVQVFKQGGASLSMAGGVLQVLAISKAWHQLDTGDQEARQHARVSLLTAGLGLSAAMMEISEAFAKQWGKTVAATGLKVVAGSASAVSLLIDAVCLYIAASEDAREADDDTAWARRAQATFFLGASIAGGLAVAETVGWITAAGLGLSWTGWGLLLVGLGLIAGAIALYLDDTPTEEWVKKSIWGTASDKWSSLQVEQNELNKILLGVRVDFEAGVRMMTKVYPSAMGASVGQEPTDIYDARITLYIPKALRVQVRYQLTFWMSGNSDQQKGWELSSDGKFITGPGYIGDQEEAEDSVTRRAQIDRKAVSGISGQVTIWDAPMDGEIIVDEKLTAN
ncbi:T6SS effector BTH_I2691 family protein [Pseudoxanthomonas kalamensis]|uniref:T6SS effector BTH_I2691 family protein n=1 Tax=Pseudoxanthomonas kalamensis TaxID=289483 RepID=UPI001B866CE6|nr:T6SS effector BTH_I2691 family protein [Pseudoxanthomonas kalamensis]